MKNSEKDNNIPNNVERFSDYYGDLRIQKFYEELDETIQRHVNDKGVPKCVIIGLLEALKHEYLI